MYTNVVLVFLLLNIKHRIYKRCLALWKITHKTKNHSIQTMHHTHNTTIWCFSSANHVLGCIEFCLSSSSFSESGCLCGPFDNASRSVRDANHFGFARCFCPTRSIAVWIFWCKRHVESGTTKINGSRNCLVGWAGLYVVEPRKINRNAWIWRVANTLGASIRNWPKLHLE